MKPLYAILALLMIGLLAFFLIEKDGDDSQNTNLPAGSQQKDSEAGTNAGQSSKNPSAAAPNSDRSRKITPAPPRTATWHREKKGYLLSPYTSEEIAAIGVVSGSKMKDSEGNDFFVPSFEKSPFPVKPVAKPFPGRPGMVMSPFTGNAVDVRGLPPGTLVRDPGDPDQGHIFQTPEAEKEDN